MSISIRIGADAILSYRRLAYTPWHAIAEFVDNSTQAYFNNRDLLDSIFEASGEKLEVAIVYDREAGLLRVSDNSIGMSFADLERAMHVALPPENTSGRSKYGMGLKTAACWIGNCWKVRTKKLGETVEHSVMIDVLAVSQGSSDLNYQARDGRREEDHYTLIEISNHNRSFQGRTIGKIKEHLASMYRQDLRAGYLKLSWGGVDLEWSDPELLVAADGAPFRKDFKFEVEGHEITGWAGILANGSRAKAGFSIIHSGRVVKGWPDSWRPSSIYGQIQGSNDLVNQRLVGEIHLDPFEVSHTKDDILWMGDQEELVEAALLEQIADIREFAKVPIKRRDGDVGPTEVETQTALEEMKRELESPSVIDRITVDDVPATEVIDVAFDHVATVAQRKPPAFTAQLNGTFVRLFLDSDLSPNDPYVAVQASDAGVIVIVNQSHPHWSQIKGADGVLNYLRHCVYDALAEWKAAFKAGRLEPRTIKIIKDSLLRSELDMQAVS